MYKLVMKQWVDDQVDSSTGAILREAHWETSEGKVRKESVPELLAEYADDIRVGSEEGCSFFVKHCSSETSAGAFRLH